MDINEIRREHPADYNPVEKRLLDIYRIENVVHIDELVQDETDDPNGNGQELQAAQQVIAHRDHLQSITQQIHQLNNRQGGFIQQIETHFWISSLTSTETT
jgi:DNA-directed RNA polymerase specialized sigma subunit